MPSDDHGHGHRDVSGGWLRPAVFGAMDGLVTNASLVAGVGGSGASSSTIVLTGVAGLVAGAFSMATGEWVSVTSQNESVRAETENERRELARNPAAELDELAASFQARGVDAPTARAVAEQLSRDPEQALRVHAQQELGVDPEHLPSPWAAALSSFVCFAVGALLPLVTFLLGGAALWPALVISAVALALAGAITARFTGRSAAYSAGRQLALGALAAAVTFAVGSAIGTTVT